MKKTAKNLEIKTKPEGIRKSYQTKIKHERHKLSNQYLLILKMRLENTLEANNQKRKKKHEKYQKLTNQCQKTRVLPTRKKNSKINSNYQY